jgi:hypothetical protein
MPKRVIPVMLVCLFAVRRLAQDLGDIQIHGFATQGFLFSSKNNYLSMKSSTGSLQWTEGAIGVSDAVTDNLRVGIQLHMYQLGQFGGPNIQVDWASGDYRLNDQLGFRAGKIKTPLGLFNDSQDVDSLFLWILLPQAMYPVDNRDFNLSELGGEVYGGLSLGKRAGNVQYRVHVGESAFDANGGYAETLAELGLVFRNPPSGRTFGSDVRWLTPWHGFLVGSSTVSQAIDGTGPNGSIHVAPCLNLSQYAQWENKKLYLAGEYWRTPINPVLTVGSITFPLPLDQRAWYAMASYRLSKKLQVGSYYSHYVNKGGDTTLAANYSKDFVLSGRYNFNPYFYGKVEGHFLRGTGLGYYMNTNPEGLKPDSDMLAARVGFTF